MRSFTQMAKQFMAKQLKIQNKGKEEAELGKLLEDTYSRGVRDGAGKISLRTIADDLHRRGLSRSGLVLDKDTEAVLEIRSLKEST